MKRTEDQSNKDVPVGCSCGGGGAGEGSPVLPCLQLLWFQQVWSVAGLGGEVGSRHGPLAL